MRIEIICRAVKQHITINSTACDVNRTGFVNKSGLRDNAGLREEIRLKPPLQQDLADAAYTFWLKPALGSVIMENWRRTCTATYAGRGADASKLGRIDGSSLFCMATLINALRARPRINSRCRTYYWRFL